MQREIIFRGKRIDNNEWVEGYLLSDRCKELFYICEGVGGNGIDVITETIGQYTGLKDKNGLMIFEGDKVNVYNKPYKVKSSIVVWGKKSHGWSLKCEIIKENPFDPSLKYYSLESSKNIEVIGNIHE